MPEPLISVALFVQVRLTQFRRRSRQIAINTIAQLWETVGVQEGTLRTIQVEDGGEPTSVFAWLFASSTIRLLTRQDRWECLQSTGKAVLQNLR